MTAGGSIKRWTKNLFIFLRQGAKLSASLQLTGTNRILTKEYYVQPGAKPIHAEDENSFHNNDIKCKWNFVTKGLLQITNDSKNTAYNIRLLNAHKIFDEIDKSSTVVNLAPEEGLQVNIKFFQFYYAPKGSEPDVKPDLIPIRKKRALLKIRYENKKGNKFYTKFIISFSNNIKSSARWAPVDVPE